MTDDLNFVQKARREKLDQLVARGIAPYAYSFHKTHDAAAAVAALPDGAEEGPSVRVAGRLVSNVWKTVSPGVNVRYKSLDTILAYYCSEDENGNLSATAPQKIKSRWAY